MVDWSSLSIELTTKHLCGDWHAEHITSELTMGVSIVDVCGTLENLSKRYKCERSAVQVKIKD